MIQPVIHTGNQTRRDSHEEMITDDPPDAILFSNQANTFAVDVSFSIPGHTMILAD